MIINEYAGSGGDLLPFLFRQNKIGALVGRRTWGGLVGIYNYPVLIDGGQVTAPRVAFRNAQGALDVENKGVAPDIDVDLDPKMWRLDEICRSKKQWKSRLLPSKKIPSVSQRRGHFQTTKRLNRTRIVTKSGCLSGSRFFSIRSNTHNSDIKGDRNYLL
jgi:C-terminal processing protease CtpA/Prc